MGFKFLLFILFCFSLNQVNSQNLVKYQVIGNSIGAKSISEKDFKSYLKGKNTFWENNIQVSIVLPSSSHPNAEEIARLVYNKSHTSLRKYWLSLVFQGRVASPKFCDNDEEIIDFVKSRKGAIGIIHKSSDVPDIYKISIY